MKQSQAIQSLLVSSKNTDSGSSDTLVIGSLSDYRSKSIFCIAEAMSQIYFMYNPMDM